MSAHVIKVISGVMCFAYGLFLAFVALDLSLTGQGIHLRATSRAAVFGIVAVCVLCGVVLAGSGVFIVMKHRSVLSKRTRTLAAGIVFASISISSGAVYYMRTHAMSAAQMIEEDLKLLDADHVQKNGGA